MKTTTGITLAASALAAVALVTACSSSGSTSSSTTPGPHTSPATAAASAYPVTITTCGQKVTFDQAPSRAVSNDINTFEDMAALGLEPRMAGTFGLSGYGPNGKGDVPTRDTAAFSRVKQISPDYIKLEPLIGAKPDFLFAGWNYGLSVGTVLTPDNLAKYGIKTLVLSESCAHVVKTKQSVSIADTYSDLTNLGKIFNVRARAAAVIASMEKQIATVHAKLTGTAPKSVFLYDSGTDAPFTAPGLAEPDALIRLAGGTNIFHSLKQSWTSVSWEQVVKANPQCIIVNDYGTPTYAQKVTFLRSSPITENLTAVKNGCFIHLDYGQLTPSPNNAVAVATIAKALHPDQIG
jgi:iron complex transport system substrate-binding protein